MVIRARQEGRGDMKGAWKGWGNRGQRLLAGSPGSPVEREGTRVGDDVESRWGGMTHA
jgi:hypothetical protein